MSLQHITNIFAYSRIVKTTAASNLGVHFFTTYTRNYGLYICTNNKNNLQFCHLLVLLEVSFMHTGGPTCVPLPLLKDHR